MHNPERQEHLPELSLRELLMDQDRESLISVRAEMLDKLSNLEHSIHLINDVIDAPNGNIELGRE